MADLGAVGTDDTPDDTVEYIRAFDLTQAVMADMIPVQGVDPDETTSEGGAGNAPAVGYATSG